MKVLLINGSPRANGNTAAALKIVSERLAARAIETEEFLLGARPVRGCISCGGCKKTNRCAFGDDGCNSLIEALLRADGVVIGSPVYFAAPNGALCALLDRAFYATSTYSQLLRAKPAAALVTCESVGGTSALDRLYRYFSPSQMPIVTSGDYMVFRRGEITGGDAKALRLLGELSDNMARALADAAK